MVSTGHKWIVESYGTEHDGSTSHAVNVIDPTDPNSFLFSIAQSQCRWSSSGRHSAFESGTDNSVSFIPHPQYAREI